MKRPYLTALVLLALGPTLPAHAQQPYPNRPIKVIVGYPAGGTLDGPARIVTQTMSRLAGQSFVVENRPGASANISAEIVAKAPADGYTLLLSSSSLSSSGALFKNLPFEPTKDFRHVGRFCTLPTVIVARKDLPANTLQEVVDLAKQNPGKLTYGSPGTGTGAHMSGEVLNRYAGIRITHIPFKGSAQALTNISGGHIDLMIGGLSTIEGAIKGKLVKVLAVTNPEPSPDLVDAPTIQQALKDYQAPRQYQFSTWLGLSAPAGTPDAVIDRLQALLQAALQDSKTRQELTAIGVSPGFLPGIALREQIDEEVPAYAKVVKEIGIAFD